MENEQALDDALEVLEDTEAELDRLRRANAEMAECLDAVAVDIAASGRHYQGCGLFDTNKPGECSCGLIRLRNRVKAALARGRQG